MTMDDKMMNSPTSTEEVPHGEPIKSSSLRAQHPPPRLVPVIWSALCAIASFILICFGFAQAYTMDPDLTGLGAPPVTVMSAVVGLAMFIEIITFLTWPPTVLLIEQTKFYRDFFYGSAIFFGFFSMTFYAATGEALAAFGCSLWVFQAITGLVCLHRLMRVQEIKAPTPVKQQLRHCCGVGCCTKSGWGMCCRWTLWIALLLFFVQACCILSDQITYLEQGKGTNNIPIMLVSATSVTGKISKLAIHCEGTQAANDPVVLLEAGGGSGLGSMMPLLNNLTTTFGLRVCAYDRSGYGFSETSLPYPEMDNAPFMIYQVLETIGEKGPYVCAGHSAGGTECRSLRRLYPLNVTGVVLLDAYCNYGACNIEEVWFQAQGLPDAYSSIYGMRLGLVDASRYFSPFTFLRLLPTGSGLMTANLGGNMAWNAQYFGFRPAKNESERNSIIESMWWTPDILGPIPLVIATGGINRTCEEAGVSGDACTDLNTRQTATALEIQKYLATSNFSIAFNCNQCDHGYVQKLPDIAAKAVMYAVEASKTNAWPSWPFQ